MWAPSTLSNPPTECWCHSPRKALMILWYMAHPYKFVRRTLTSAELEQVLEDECHLHVHRSVVQSGSGTVGARADVSTTDEVV